MILGLCALLLSSTSAHKHNVDARSLQTEEYPKVAGYRPLSNIADHNAIDMDQAAMETELAFGTPDSYKRAEIIYQEGGNSKSYAAVTLDEALKTDLPKGSIIMGENEAGEVVSGRAMDQFFTGDKVIHIQYDTTSDQANHVSCRVGGLVGSSTDPQFDGCFTESGSLETTVGDVKSSLSYSYDREVNNDNNRTLAGFSLLAEERMYRCDNCPYMDFKIFYDYYQVFDYAHQYATACFGLTSTNFVNGNADFKDYDYDGRTQIIKKTTAYISAYMYVIRELEDAIDDCSQSCVTCNDDPVHAWDEAVAFYTGSYEGANGEGSGKMFYAVADKRCANFFTCGEKGGSIGGTSRANVEVFDQFKKGQQNLLDGKCEEAEANKEKIANLMHIPLIQGSLRYGYIKYTEQFGDKQEAEGAVFMAGVIPYVHKCNPSDAKIIYDNLAVGSGIPDFPAVKAAFERNYKCLGITCGEVGGIYRRVEKDYYDDTKPCQDGDEGGASGDDKNESSAHNYSVGAVTLSSLGALLFV